MLAPAAPQEVDALSAEDAIGRLRALGHPATLFGESERDRLLRLHVVQRSISMHAQARPAGGQHQRSLRARTPV